MNSCPKLYDFVALLLDQPELGLDRGQVGTIVEEYESGVFEVEFSDPNGRAYALETLHAEQLLVLHHQPSGNGALRRFADQVDYARFDEILARVPDVKPRSGDEL